MRKFILSVWDFFINKKDEKIPHDFQLDTLVTEYKYFNQLAKNYHRQILKKKFSRLIRYHKIAFTKTIFLFLFIGAALYFIYQNFEPRIVIRNQFQARIQPDSTIVIHWVVNPELKKYLNYIASTETTVRNGDTLQAYRTRCGDTSSSAIGRYQMMKAARVSVGLGSVPESVFLNWPELQDIACYKFLQQNQKVLNPFIQQYEGQNINGYYLTSTGILSLSHALGAGGAMTWIRNGCQESQLPNGAPHADRRLTLQKYRLVFPGN